MDPREQDTREKIDELEKAIAGGAAPEKLYSLAASAIVAIDFRTSDAMIGIPEGRPRSRPRPGLGHLSGPGEAS